MEITNTKKWYELLDIHYYEHLKATYHISWNENLDKNHNTSLET